MAHRTLLLTLVTATIMTAATSPAAAQVQTSWRMAYDAGVQALAEDRLGDAITAFRRAIESNPDAQEPYAAIRIAYGIKGRTVSEAGGDGMLLRLAHQQIDRREYAKAEEMLERLLDGHFANPATHYALSLGKHRQGKLTDAEPIDKRWHGLVAAILASGTGESPQAAFLVQAHIEEYFIVSIVLRCRVMQQDLITPPEGGVYDALTIGCPEGTRVVYFDVSAWGPDPAWRLKVYRAAQARTR